MRDPEDEFLERWCRRGDVEALSALFDSAAPDLLKLAIHLAGDPAEAEDLVQATFLAAIEQRERIDASRPALPWLAGVLAHKAADVRRRKARAIDAERLIERAAQEDASGPAERRELSGALAAAIDRLEEPYRRVVALRLRHGLAVADVAHVLGRSPGTVRVQLHRGLEKMRRLLPASLASALALELGAPRGLAAVKVAVMHEAGVAAALAVTTPVLGVWIMSTKTLVGSAAAVVLAALAAFTLWPEDAPATLGAGTGSALEEDGAVVDGGRVGGRDGGGLLAAREESGVERREAGAIEPRADRPAVTGTVVDGESGEPLAGVDVRLYAPREADFMEVLREHPELYAVGSKGVARPRTHGDWPHLGVLSAPARFGAEPTRSYDLPAGDAEPLARATTGSDGTFVLASEVEGGVLVCEHEGYVRRMRAAFDPGREWTVSLWRARALAGRVVTSDGEPPGVPLTLVFAAMRTPRVTLSEGETMRTFEDSELEGIGVWTVETDAAGHFRTSVAADQVYAEVLSAGWRAVSIQTLAVGEDVTIRVRSVPVLRFTDAPSGAPIERVHLLGSEQRSRYVRWSGEFLAPDGLLTLPGGSWLMESHAEDTLAFTAWADGHAARTFTITDVLAGGVYEVALERGGLPSLEGRVHRGGRACPRAEVALLGHSPLQWREDEDTLVDAVRPDAGGSFRIEAPAGTYLLRIDEGDTRYFELVELPAAALLDVDLDHTARITIEVVDGQGAGSAEHTVVLGSTDGRSFWRFTDAQGRLVFADLPPGPFTVMAPNRSTRASFTPDQKESFELARGEERFVRFVVPDAGSPRHARIEVRGVSDYTGWRARYDSAPWEPLALDGTVPMDLATDSYTLGIAAPDARRWSVEIPKSEPDGYVIVLEGGDARYRGVLQGGDGGPLGGVRIHATPRRCSTQVSASCVTGEAGEFELSGLAECVYSLAFQGDPEAVSWADKSRFEGTSFLPDEPAGADTRLEIRLVPTPPDVRVHGVVRRESDGTPLAGAMLFIECVEPAPSGGLRLGSDRSIVHADGEGRFEVGVPRTRERIVRVYVGAIGQPPVLVRTFEDSGLEEEPALELFVPE